MYTYTQKKRVLLVNYAKYPKMYSILKMSEGKC